jgi:lysophospholipase L1-like esterase
MKKSFLILTCYLLLSSGHAFSQEKGNIRWWNPVQNAFPVIEGQAWTGKVKDPYDRLPAKAEKTVRKEVWNLGHNSAGLLLRFRTNSANIIVRYGLKEGFAFPHMSSTGVSGVDLYTRTDDGAWLWCSGNRAFADTSKYEFRNIEQDERYHKLGREYRLYLPLYNSVKWMEIGVNSESTFEPLPLRQEKPIVVYGTSIAQGGCASRPGMAWTGILERQMDRPLINLGFSGNGRMETEVLDLINEIDAKIFILDCLPNLGPGPDLKSLLVSGVKKLREKHPSTPILMVEHAGFGGESTNKADRSRIEQLNQISQLAFSDLKQEGMKGIYYLPKSDLCLNMESFVDGVHPTDLGMKQYALAYEKVLRQILDEPIGIISTTKPVTQRREPDKYDWEKRHQDLLRKNLANPPKVCIVGNSIIHYWGGTTEGPVTDDSKAWKNDMQPLGVRNFGFGWDRIENVLWRVYHDELDGYAARKILIMIGTNNLTLNSHQEMLEGLKMLVQAVQQRQPNTGIVLCGLLPRVKKEKEIAELNLSIAQLAGDLSVQYADPGKIFLRNNGSLEETLFSDGLHPNAEGYKRLTPIIQKLIEK